MGRRRKSRVGEKYGLLEVIGFVGTDDLGDGIWECVCSCSGIKINANYNSLRNGKKSCGCLSGRGNPNKSMISPRRKEAQECWKLGWSLGRIAEKLGVTKQRVHQYISEYRDKTKKAGGDSVETENNA